uniref:Uncharacterized protein n=1 Tax=Alexandrium monilatum TaxID=311494 RepID=A0A7S4Q598_9DINO
MPDFLPSLRQMPMAMRPTEGLGLPTALKTPTEVIHCVFFRGKRPAAAPLAERTAALTEPREAEPNPMCPSDDLAGVSAGEAWERPPKRARAGEEIPGHWEEAYQGTSDAEAEAAGEARDVEEFCRAMRETPAWRSVLGSRPRLGKVGTIGDWLRSQGAKGITCPLGRLAARTT